MKRKTLGKIFAMYTYNPQDAIQEMNKLPNNKRKALREILEAKGMKAPKNLYYNYQTQTWID